MTLSESLDWALMTIRDKLQFGLDESQAIIRREMRVKGVLIDAVKEVKDLEKQLENLRRENAKLVLENQELRINQELSQEL